MRLFSRMITWKTPPAEIAGSCLWRFNLLISFWIMRLRERRLMSVEAFLDTNILLYAASKSPEDTKKSQRALQLIEQTRFGISLQVVQEFYHNARLKARLAISTEQMERLIGLLLASPLAVTDIDLFSHARRLCERYQLRYWDAAIVAAAVRLKAPILYSEDLSDGQIYDEVRVVNPFSKKKANA